MRPESSPVLSLKTRHFTIGRAYRLPSEKTASPIFRYATRASISHTPGTIFEFRIRNLWFIFCLRFLLFPGMSHLKDRLLERYIQYLEVERNASPRTIIAY